jgi:hypothetical protein
MMSSLKPLRQFPDPRAGSSRKALQGEHQLMLLRLEARGSGGLFAEAQKSTNLKAQLGQRTVVRQGKRLFHW